MNFGGFNMGHMGGMGHMHGHHGMGMGMGGFDRFSRPINWSALGKFDNIPEKVQKHLLKVYATLATGLLAAAIGVQLDFKYHVAGMFTQIALFGAVAGLAFIGDLMNRLIVFHVAGLLIGCNLSPLFMSVAAYRPDIIMTAFMGTAVIFACFSASALVAQRRHFLYLGGILGSAMSLMCTFRMWNFIMGGTLSSGMYMVELYMGLAIFMAHIIFDTQMIIEDAHSGRRDFVAHAMDLLTDFVAVFVRLLIILMRNADQQKRKDERDRRR
mmetsp:Transcript_29373/g.46097  ORF Transcript_29373/g.46097 Transcript_29373/m.46097 type:complete len:269 (-) Transcript_29373:1027-1833(-)